jgi:hypothetical protein
MSSTGITFKKFKHVASMSRETTAYTADVYFNGEKIGTAENRGHGAQSSFYPEPGKQHLWAEADAWAKEQVLMESYRPFRINGEVQKASGLEDFCDWQAGYELIHKDTVSFLKRNMKTKTLVIDPDQNNSLFTYKAAYNEKVHEAILKKNPNVIFLNPLPIEEAVAKVIERDKAQAAQLEAQEFGEPAPQSAPPKPRGPRP